MSSSSGGGDASLLTAMPFFQEKSAFDQCLPNLTFQQRLMGFLGCAIFGTILSFMGTMTLIGGPSAKNLQTFVVLYVLGNIIALMSTGFLLGPKAQCKQMWHKTRRYTTGIYLSLLVIVFAVAVSGQNIGLVIFLLLLEVIAGIWYTLSYIPYARQMVLNFLRPYCGPCFEAVESIRGQGGGSSAPQLGTGQGRFTKLQDVA